MGPNGLDHEFQHGLEDTARWTAAVRAIETARDDPTLPIIPTTMADMPHSWNVTADRVTPPA